MKTIKCNLACLYIVDVSVLSASGILYSKIHLIAVSLWRSWYLRNTVDQGYRVSTTTGGRNIPAEDAVYSESLPTAYHHGRCHDYMDDTKFDSHMFRNGGNPWTYY